MAFRSVFIAVFIGTALVVAAWILHSQRPATELQQPTEQLVRATGKCAMCHRQETAAIVRQFERSRHAKVGVTCLDCHRPVKGQKGKEHRGFTLAKSLTSGNCRQCHATQYRQYVRSRHASPAWAAVAGEEAFTEKQVKFAEKHHPGAVRREPNPLALKEGQAARKSGCMACHSIGKPNADGTIGSCTDCHARHQASVKLARQPETCGQCHMGPDHAQLEIYKESKHGVLYEMQKNEMNLGASPGSLTTKDMSVPTCATCHMSGLGGNEVTHNPGERLSYYLFAKVSKKRPGFKQAQQEMKQICLQCHASPQIERFYADAEAVLKATNKKVKRTEKIIKSLREDGILTDEPFDEPIEFRYFDYWHYYGRTAKHGAFMGGPDFVQWHGNYELLKERIEIKHKAEVLRRHHRGSE